MNESATIGEGAAPVAADGAEDRANGKAEQDKHTRFMRSARAAKADAVHSVPLPAVQTRVRKLKAQFSPTANEGRPQLAPSARRGQNARGNDGGMSSLAQAAQAISGEEEGEKNKEEEDDDEDEDEEYAEGLMRKEPPKRARARARGLQNRQDPSRPHDLSWLLLDQPEDAARVPP
ncbi:hypothetical protein T492DRAFT_961209 [Pavlovales sp. CCMP2436]|nr:hypothetical protein T492DRAFT_961209 [Pavlovales sp. CCMP2436]